MTYSFKNEPPNPRAFVEFREDCGWGRLDEDTAKATLAAGLVNVCAYDDGQLIGFGRVIGDGAIYFNVQDLIVSEAYRGRGIGREVLTLLLDEIRKIAAPGAIVGLMSTVGSEPFYARHGFIARPNNSFGAGMLLRL